MLDPNGLRKYELECLRMASDCMQLANGLESPALQSHFISLAREWERRALEGPGADIEPENFAERTCPA